MGGIIGGDGPTRIIRDDGTETYAVAEFVQVSINGEEPVILVEDGRPVTPPEGSRVSLHQKGGKERG